MLVVLVVEVEIVVLIARVAGLVVIPLAQYQLAASRLIDIEIQATNLNSSQRATWVLNVRVSRPICLSTCFRRANQRTSKTTSATTKLS